QAEAAGASSHTDPTREEQASSIERPGPSKKALSRDSMLRPCHTTSLDEMGSPSPITGWRRVRRTFYQAPTSCCAQCQPKPAGHADEVDSTALPYPCGNDSPSGKRRLMPTELSENNPDQTYSALQGPRPYCPGMMPAPHMEGPSHDACVGPSSSWDDASGTCSWHEATYGRPHANDACTPCDETSRLSHDGGHSARNSTFSEVSPSDFSARKERSSSYYT
ncbi:hypothetical protein GH733_009223, partial [Mirounga leonina]